MKKIIVICLLTVGLIFTIVGCSENSIKKVNIYEMNSFREVKEGSLREITNSDDITSLTNAFATANKQLGIVNMPNPHYKIDLGKDLYFLWLVEEHGTMTIMNLMDTHTIYSLSKNSISDIKQIISSYY